MTCRFLQSDQHLIDYAASIQLKGGFPGIGSVSEIELAAGGLRPISGRTQHRGPAAIVPAPDAEERLREVGGAHLERVRAQRLDFALELLEPKRKDRLHCLNLPSLEPTISRPLP